MLWHFLLLLPLSPQAALEMFYIWVSPWLHLGETESENTRAPAHNHKWCCGIFASIATVTTGSVWNVSHLGVFHLIFAESSHRGYCKQSLTLDLAATYLTAVTALCQWTIVVCMHRQCWVKFLRHSASLSSFKSKLKTHLFSPAYWSVVFGTNP